MRSLLTAQSMRECEERFFQTASVRSIDVMQRAAEALADAVRESVPAGQSVFFACGSGGNGGDGIACACILKDEYETRIVLPHPVRSADAAENLRRAEMLGVAVCRQVCEKPNLWVDALFGTGLSRAPEGDYANLMDRMNADNVPIIAADIPSGLNGTTGKAYAHCIRATRTITFGFGKTGLFLQDGLDFCGKVKIAPVGFPESAFPGDVWLTDAGDAAQFLPERKRNVYKNLCGHLLIVAGSFGMAGAAALCARAAMRTGAGLVSVACPVSIVPVLQTLVPGAMCIPIAEKDGAMQMCDALENAFEGKTAAVVGCGLSMRTDPQVVKAVLQSNLPAVADADALNIIARNKFQNLLGENHIITPHPGEARRLLGDCENADALLNNPIAAANALNRWGACALFKGAACTIVNGKERYISASGCSGMARGGSGDILSGIIGALIAEKSPRSMALNAALASEIHGLAGERAQAKYSTRGMTAQDIPDCIAEVIS